MHWKRRTAALSCLLLGSCQTAEVLVEAPEAFWATAEAIPEALIMDIVSIIELIAGAIL